MQQVPEERHFRYCTLLALLQHARAEIEKNLVLKHCIFTYRDLVVLGCGGWVGVSIESQEYISPHLGMLRDALQVAILHITEFDWPIIMQVP